MRFFVCNVFCNRYYDIALAAETDICSQMFDNDPSDPLADEKLDFNKTLAFTNLPN